MYEVSVLQSNKFTQHQGKHMNIQTDIENLGLLGCPL